MTEQTKETSLSITAELVRELLERNGIPRHKHSSVVEEFFGLSRSAAHRRVHGNASWTVEELQKLAAHYGESLVELYGGYEDGESAVFLHGGLSYKCHVWLGDETTNHEGFVAVRMGTRILVMSGREASDAVVLKVLRFTVDQTKQII